MSDYIKSRGPRLPVMLIIQAGETKFEAMFDARIDSKEDFSVDTPSYPIERDFDTSISTVNHQIQLQMNLFLTPAPVTWASFFGRSIEQVKDTLIRMYWLHCPVTVKTQDDTYENMAIKSMTFKRSGETGDAYEVNLVLTHVKITSHKYTEAARGVRGSGGTPDTSPGVSGGSNSGEGRSAGRGVTGLGGTVYAPPGISSGVLAVEQSEGTLEETERLGHHSGVY